MKTRMLVWAVVGYATAGLAFWLFVITATDPPQLLAFIGLGAVFAVGPLGCFWMLYFVIRHEKHPLPWMLLAFVPYFAVGYYFERVRRNGLGARLGKTARSS